MRLIIACMLSVALVGPSAAAANITGLWKSERGVLARVAECGDAFCVTIVSGKFHGRTIGRFDGDNGSYEGRITDPNTDRHYAGSARVEGTSMIVRGCALKVFCKSQVWTKQ
ncbi:DUF2147 domain-containing protein [Pararhizobium mangrovi]|uniref:DUF2147 domain-containing protein n=1 Tax=Pararhizobium mangrovi TaxID=2590452 RepID=A0A506UAF8_9HYPH|nr:DUF2147 domain-containing protein [Pararhizobium mangrovi]TPW29945.1 DUF2147 domain-containing protein [Pararhizobium mangrovi]